MTTIINHRTEGIDTVRGIAAISVVLIHSFYLPKDYENISFFVRMIFARFAVPFFFITSGFFYAKGLDSKRSVNEQFWKSFSKIIMLYVIWTLLHFLNPNFHAIAENGIFNAYYFKLIKLIESKGTIWLLIVGPTGHLWFFLSLSVTLLTFTIFNFHKRIKCSIYLSLLIYILGVLGGSYRATPIGMNIFYYTNYFIFPGLFTFTIGFWLYSKRSFAFINPWFGSIVWAFGMIVHTFEGFLLNQKYNIAFQHDYVFSTFIMGLGAFIWGLSNPEWMKNKLLIKIGSFSLGIYLLQELVAGRLGKLFSFFNIPGSLSQSLAPIFIILLSIGVTFILTLWSPTKKIIT